MNNFDYYKNISHCPICNGVLLNEFIYKNILQKSCLKSNHTIIFRYYKIFISEEDIPNFISISVNNNKSIWFNWYYNGSYFTHPTFSLNDSTAIHHKYDLPILNKSNFYNIQEELLTYFYFL